MDTYVYLQTQIVHHLLENYNMIPTIPYSSFRMGSRYYTGVNSQ